MLRRVESPVTIVTLDLSALRPMEQQVAFRVDLTAVWARQFVGAFRVYFLWHHSPFVPVCFSITIQ